MDANEKNYNIYRLIRLWQDLTMNEIAEALNIGTGTVSLLENGHRQPTREVRAKYARVFPIDESYFSFIEAYGKME